MKLGIMPHTRMRSLKTLQDSPDPTPEILKCMTLQEVLDTRHEHDTHFTTYKVVGETEWPRLAKSVLREIRGAGQDVVSQYIIMDWDTPKAEGSKDKVPLNDETFEYFINLLYGREGEIGNWCAAYTTKNGGRIIYELPVAIPVDVVEEYIAGMIHDWKRSGVEMDKACKDWTRLFRAPQVIRDNERSEESPYFFMDTQDKTVNIEKLLRLDRGVQPIERYEGDSSVPLSEEMPLYLHRKNPTSSSRSAVQTAFYKVAKKVLKGKEPYACIFEGASMCESGNRMTTIGKYLGIVTPLLIKEFKDLTPQHIFALFYTELCKLEPDSGTPCWLTHAWKYLLTIWEKEIAKENARREVEAVTLSETKDVLDTMVEGMTTWCDAEELRSDDRNIRHEYVRAHAFVTLNKFFFLLSECGEYDTFAITKEGLISRIRKTHMNKIIETKTVNVQGAEIDVTPITIQNEYTTAVEKITLKPQLHAQGIVEDLNGKHPRLVMPMYRRNPKLEAEYNEQVDTWLMWFFGDHYHTVCTWIGRALAFEEGPICALSIKGPGGIGKKLLTTGLEECLEDPVSATGHDISGNFNGGLAKSPFLFVNEGWPTKRGTMSASDLFKSLTAGDAVVVREMYKPPVTVINPMRIILTANDHDLLNGLSKDKSLSPESRKAVGDRLYHVDLGGEAARYLDGLGGREFTEKEGARWIRHDNGLYASDFVVAKHFLWLYETRPERDMRQRFLVMGNCAESSTMFDEMLQGKSIVPCIKAILQLIEGKVTRKNTILIDAKTAKVYVTAGGVHEYAVSVLDERFLELRDVSLALKNISMTEDGEEIHHVKWTELDCCAIAQFAKNMGFASDVLRGIIDKQRELTRNK